MIEITLKTDEELGVQTVYIGVDPVTGLDVYRRFKGLRSDVHEKQHIITYEEWLIAKDGKVYDRFYSQRQYYVVDILDTEPQQLLYSYWFNALAPTLIPEIENSLLKKIPFNENGYVIKSES